MKKTGRVLAAGLAALMGAGLLAGCGSSSGSTSASGSTASAEASTEAGASSADASSGKKVTLNFGIWDENQRAAMQSMVDAYTKENPNVTINIQLTPYKGGEYWTKLEAAATGGTAPDVFWINVLHLDSYEEGGILADLTDDIKASDINDNFPETLVNNFVRDGKNYAVPKDFDTNALWYNKDLFDQAGVDYPTDDMSYDDLVALCKELKDKLPDGVYPFACPVDFQTWYYQTIYANGGYILSDDKKSTGYDDPKTQQGIQCWIDLINDGYSPSADTLAETGADAMFEGQQIAMNFAGSYMVPEYASNDTIKDKINCVEIPTYNGKNDNTINGLGFAVYSKSKNLDEAKKFAIWLGSQEAQDIQGKTGVVISARNDCQKDFSEANPQYNLAAYTNHVDDAYPLPVCDNAAELYDTESKWITKAYTGEMSLADACASLKKEADALLQ
jgi:multiple sugar transport system substrate-binding protein